MPKDQVTSLQKFEWPAGTMEEGFPVEPFEDVVIIEQIVEEMSKGGILIANTASSKMPMGRVVAVGPGKMYTAAITASESIQTAIFIPTRLRVGDIVMWGRYRTGGEPWLFNGKRYVSAREGDLGGRVVDRNAEISVVEG